MRSREAPDQWPGIVDWVLALVYRVALLLRSNRAPLILYPSVGWRYFCIVRSSPGADFDRYRICKVLYHECFPGGRNTWLRGGDPGTHATAIIAWSVSVCMYVCVYIRSLSSIVRAQAQPCVCNAPVTARAITANHCKVLSDSTLLVYVLLVDLVLQTCRSSFFFCNLSTYLPQ